MEAAWWRALRIATRQTATPLRSRRCSASASTHCQPVKRVRQARSQISPARTATAQQHGGDRADYAAGRAWSASDHCAPTVIVHRCRRGTAWHSAAASTASLVSMPPPAEVHSCPRTPGSLLRVDSTFVGARQSTIIPLALSCIPLQIIAWCSPVTAVAIVPHFRPTCGLRQTRGGMTSLMTKLLTHRSRLR